MIIKYRESYYRVDERLTADIAIEECGLFPVSSTADLERSGIKYLRDLDSLETTTITPLTRYYFEKFLSRFAVRLPTPVVDE